LRRYDEDDGDLDAVPTGQTCKHCAAWQGLRTKVGPVQVESS
jgi:hypothetical protein